MTNHEAVTASIGPFTATLCGVMTLFSRLVTLLLLRSCQSCSVMVGVPVSVRETVNEFELLASRNTSALAAKVAADSVVIVNGPVPVNSTLVSLPDAASGSSAARLLTIFATVS